MQIEALTIFCDVVRLHSFSRGALANSVSQSAASQAIRQIEKQLDTQLIDRSTRPWRLTTEGKLFFKGAKDVIERFHKLEEELRQRQRPRGYTVRLASIYSVRFHDVSEFVSRFRASRPGADVDLEYMHPNEVYDRVLEDQYDLGFISFATPRRDLTVIPWEQQAMVVACRPGHHLARSTEDSYGAPPRELSDEPFIAFDRGLPVRREIDRFLRRQGADVRVVAEFDNIENIKQAVEDGDGVAVLPERTLRREIEDKTLVAVPFRLAPGVSPPVRPVSIIHRRKRRLNPAVTELIGLLLDGRPGQPGETPAHPKIEAAL